MDAKKLAMLAQLQDSISAIESDSNIIVSNNASFKKESNRGSSSRKVKEELPLSFSEDFCEENDSDKAFKKISDLVRVRDRSIHEVRKRLHELDFTDEGIDFAIQKALRCGYLDDHRFAGVYVRSKFNQGKGVSGIKNELKSHNIPEDLIEDALSENLPEDSEEERAFRYLRRKPSRSKNPFQASYAKLIRRGFSSSAALAATKKWMNEQAHL